MILMMKVSLGGNYLKYWENLFFGNGGLLSYKIINQSKPIINKDQTAHLICSKSFMAMTGLAANVRSGKYYCAFSLSILLQNRHFNGFINFKSISMDELQNSMTPAKHVLDNNNLSIMIKINVLLNY